MSTQQDKKQRVSALPICSTKWFKQDVKETRSAQEVMSLRREYLELSPEVRVIISKIHETPTGKPFYSYNLFDNSATAAEWVNDQQEKTYCVMVNSNVPLYPYFDVERPPEPTNVPRLSFDDWLNNIIDLIGECFNHLSNGECRPTRSDYAIYKTEYSAQTGFHPKFSVHLHLLRFKMESLEVMRKFKIALSSYLAKKLKRQEKKTRSIHHLRNCDYECDIDFSVYSRDRNFRLALNGKPGKPPFTLFQAPHGIDLSSKTDQILSTFINQLEMGNDYAVRFVEINEQNYEKLVPVVNKTKKKSASVIDSSARLSRTLKTFRNKIEEKLTALIQSRLGDNLVVEQTEKNTSFYIRAAGPRKCFFYTDDSMHDSNQSMIFIDKFGNCYYYCLHPNHPKRYDLQFNVYGLLENPSIEITIDRKISTLLTGEIISDKDMADIFIEIKGHNIATTDKGSCKGYMWNTVSKLWGEICEDDILKEMFNLMGPTKHNYIRYTIKPVINKLKNLLQKCDDPKKKGALQDDLRELEKHKSRLKVAYSKTFENLVKCKHASTIASILLYQPGFENQINMTHPFLIPYKDGKVIDITNSMIRERVKEDYFSHEFPCNYLGLDEKKNPYHRMDDFFADLFEDAELREFMRLLCGIFLTGMPLRYVTFLIGVGSNGKGTLMKLLRKCMGEEYFTSLSRDFLSEKKASDPNKPEPAALDLKGKRVSHIAETPQNWKLDSSMFKNLASAGTDYLKARGLYTGKYQTFPMTSKAIIESQNFPVMDVYDQALIDRTIVIPFNTRFVADETMITRIEDSEVRHLIKDISKIDYLMKNLDLVFSYFLNAAIDWYQQYHGDFPKLPKICKHFQDTLFKEQDIVQQFIDEHCNTNVFDKKEWTSDLGDVYSEFKQYMSHVLSMPDKYQMSMKKFKDALNKKGHKHKRNGQRLYKIGIVTRVERHVYNK